MKKYISVGKALVAIILCSIVSSFCVLFFLCKPNPYDFRLVNLMEKNSIDRAKNPAFLYYDSIITGNRSRLSSFHGNDRDIDIVLQKAPKSGLEIHKAGRVNNIAWALLSFDSPRGWRILSVGIFHEKDGVWYCLQSGF